MLFDRLGNRKYLTAGERRAFIAKAEGASPLVETFCLTLAYTGARISEVLALTPERVDIAARAIIIECLKKRRQGVYRAVPVPDKLLSRLESVHGVSARQSDPDSKHYPLWTWSRTTAWQRVKEMMLQAGISEHRAMPKALRHAFGVQATQVSVPINILQRWMGHSRLTTTAIYAEALGDEERALAKRMWR